MRSSSKIALIATAYILLVYFLYLTESGVTDNGINTFVDALWYSVVTMSTVGYGDLVPVTPIGKALGLVFIVGSVGLVGYLISQLTTQIGIIVENKKLGLNGTNFKGHILIIGWNHFAKQVVDEIINTNKKIAIVTNHREDIDLIHQSFSSKDVFALFSDYDNYENLELANISQSSIVFINFEDDSDSLIYILNLKKRYKDLRYMVSLNKPSLRETFYAAGVRYVVSKNEFASKMVASYTFEPDVATIAESIMTTAIEDEDHDILEYCVTENNPFLNQDYLDAYINMKVEYDSVLMGISKKTESGWKILKNPAKGTTIEQGNYLILMINGSSKDKIDELFGVPQGRMSD